MSGVYLVENLERKKLLEEQLGEEKDCIYITLKTPSLELEKKFRQIENSENIFFIDGIAKEVGKVLRKKNIAYTSPDALTELSIKVAERVSNHGEQDKFVVLDSVNAIQKYNENKAILHFLHTLSTRLRLEEIDLYMLEGEGEIEKKISDYLKQFIDI